MSILWFYFEQILVFGLRVVNAWDLVSTNPLTSDVNGSWLKKKRTKLICSYIGPFVYYSQIEIWHLDNLI